MSIKLHMGETCLKAKVAYEARSGIFGIEYRVGAFESDGIAFDHCKMIALAILKLRDAGRL